jgi:hypothetical protein
MNPEKAIIVIAISMQRSVAVVVATDSQWVEMEVDAISAYTDDIGILEPDDYKNEPGLYLWEGTLKCVVTGAPDCQEPETEYDGKLRKILPGEMEELLAMTPPPSPGYIDEEDLPIPLP